MKKINIFFILIYFCINNVYGQIKDTISESKTSLTVELLMVEYRHTDGFMWGFDIVNGQSNYLGETSFNAKGNNTDGNVSINFDTTNRLGDAFKLNLQALIQNSQAVIYQNPRVTVKDGQPATINISEDRHIQLQTSSVNGLTTSLTKLSAGVKLQITPKIMGNGNISLSVIGTLSDFLLYDDSASYYAVETSTIDTSIDLPIDKTLVIGGILKEKQFTSKGGIPFLRSIPIIGKLFSGVKNETNIVETVIYISVYFQKNSNIGDGPRLMNYESKDIKELKKNFSKLYEKRKRKRKMDQK